MLAIPAGGGRDLRCLSRQRNVHTASSRRFPRSESASRPGYPRCGELCVFQKNSFESSGFTVCDHASPSSFACGRSRDGTCESTVPHGRCRYHPSLAPWSSWETCDGYSAICPRETRRTRFRSGGPQKGEHSSSLTVPLVLHHLTVHTSHRKVRSFSIVPLWATRLSLWKKHHFSETPSPILRT
jgi:hypothetical protein